MSERIKELEEALLREQRENDKLVADAGRNIERHREHERLVEQSRDKALRELAAAQREIERLRTALKFVETRGPTNYRTELGMDVFTCPACRREAMKDCEWHAKNCVLNRALAAESEGAK